MTEAKFTPEQEIVMTLPDGTTYTEEQILTISFFRRVPAILHKMLKDVPDIKEANDPRFVEAMDAAVKQASADEEMFLLELAYGNTTRAKGARAAIMVETYRHLRGEEITRGDVAYVKHETDKGNPGTW